LTADGTFPASQNQCHFPVSGLCNGPVIFPGWAASRAGNKEGIRPIPKGRQKSRFTGPRLPPRGLVKGFSEIRMAMALNSSNPFAAATFEPGAFGDEDSIW